MNLQKFIEQYKTDLPVTYEITDSQIVIKFDEMANINGAFLEVPGNAELRMFSNLLNGRICRFVGNKLENCNIAVISIRSLMI